MIAISGKTRCFFWGATVFDTRAHTYTLTHLHTYTLTHAHAHTHTHAHAHAHAHTHTYAFEGFEAEKRSVPRLSLRFYSLTPTFVKYDGSTNRK